MLRLLFSSAGEVGFGEDIKHVGPERDPLFQTTEFEWWCHAFRVSAGAL